jgi:plastocyanin
LPLLPAFITDYLKDRECLTTARSQRDTMMRSLLVGLLVLLISSCTGDGVTDPDARTIEMLENSFNPSTLTIPAGTLVIWRNTTGTHTITPDGHSQWVDKGDISVTGEAQRVTFNTPGTYEFFCQHHEVMTGTITVTS